MLADNHDNPVEHWGRQGRENEKTPVPYGIGVLVAPSGIDPLT